MKSALRRASTQPDTGEASHGDSMAAKRSSTTASDTSRRPSLATISRRLGRSKKPQSTSNPASTESNKLGQLFFALPNELHALVLSFLGPQDIFTLRLTCRTTNTILSLCAPTILSVHVPQTLPPERFLHILSLHPPPIPNVSLSYHLTLLRRHAVLTHLSTILTSYMQMKIYMIPPVRHQRVTSLDSTRVALLSSHLYPALWTIDHYLSTYRHLLLHVHPSHTSRERSRFWRCVPCGTALEAVAASYDLASLVPAYQVMRLLGIHLKVSSRAPSYAGTIERVVRRWSRKPAGEEELALVMLLGGTEVLRRVTVLKGTYNSRLEVVRGFLETVEEAVEEKRALQLEREQREKPRVARMVVGKKGIERVELVVEAERQQAAEEERRRQQLQEATSNGKAPEIPATDANDEAHANSQPNTSIPISNDPNDPTDDDPITALSLPHHLITEQTLDQIPLLEDILLPQLRRRIEAEQLLDYLPPEEREEELETPYHWIRRVVCGEEDDIDGRQGRRRDGEGEEGEGDEEGDEGRQDVAEQEQEHGLAGGAAGGGLRDNDPVMAPWLPQQQQQGGLGGGTAAAAAAAAAGVGGSMPGMSTDVFGAMRRHMQLNLGGPDLVAFRNEQR